MGHSTTPEKQPLLDKRKDSKVPLPDLAFELPFEKEDSDHPKNSQQAEDNIADLNHQVKQDKLQQSDLSNSSQADEGVLPSRKDWKSSTGQHYHSRTRRRSDNLKQAIHQETRFSLPTDFEEGDYWLGYESKRKLEGFYGRSGSLSITNDSKQTISEEQFENDEQIYLDDHLQPDNSQIQQSTELAGI